MALLTDFFNKLKGDKARPGEKLASLPDDMNVIGGFNISGVSALAVKHEEIFSVTTQRAVTVSRPLTFR